jgi:hypothetical protein
MEETCVCIGGGSGVGGEMGVKMLDGSLGGWGGGGGADLWVRRSTALTRYVCEGVWGLCVFTSLWWWWQGGERGEGVWACGRMREEGGWQEADLLVRRSTALTRYGGNMCLYWGR